MAHPVTIAAVTAAREGLPPYPADVIGATVELYDATLEILDRRPVFGAVAESLAFGLLSVTDYLGADTVRLTLMQHRATPADALTRERFGR